MNARTVWTILRKELLATVRDRRTLIMMIGVPLLLYPAMLLIGLQAALIQHQKLDLTVSRVAVIAVDRPVIENWLRRNGKLEVVESKNPREDLRRGKLDAVVLAEGVVQTVLDAGGQVCIEILYDSTEFGSRDAAARIDRTLTDISSVLRRGRLERVGIEESYVYPLHFQRQDVASPEKTTGNLLGIALPFFMVMTIALGAFYPAVDLTAGEKERGTFETLLSTPASKFEIVTGKFLAVFLLAMITGLLNLLSMAATFVFALAQLGDVLAQEIPFAIGFGPLAYLAILGVTIPLAFFISALMMSLAVFARSFKEAQNYITPFFLAIIMPASVAAMPGVELGPATVFIPITNVVLLFKELMIGQASLEMTFAVLLATAVYALLALLFAAWVFQREEVVLSEERGIPLTFHRSEIIPSDAPTPGYALGLYALVLLAIFYAGSWLQHRGLWTGLLATEWGIILLPALGALWFARIRFAPALSLAPLTRRHLLGALCIGPTAVVLLIQLGVWSNEILPVPPDYKNAFTELFDTGGAPSRLVLLLFIVAVSPAICEEILFRGVLLSGLRARLGVGGSIVAVGFLFGLFHLSVYRLLPTMLMGMLLTYLVLRSGSILSGMAVHFLSNALAVLLATKTYPAGFERLFDLKTIELQGLPAWVLGITAAVFVAGIALIEQARRDGNR